jgi:hypothetical protein
VLCLVIVLRRGDDGQWKFDSWGVLGADGIGVVGWVIYRWLYCRLFSYVVVVMLSCC